MNGTDAVRLKRGTALPAVLVAGLVVAGGGMTATSRALAATTCAAGTTMNVVAHQDDDLLFLSPDLLKDVQADRCVRTVFLTAGDDNRDQTYWRARETGILTAYATMAGVANAWSTSDAGVAGHPIVVRTLVARPNVSVAFMRLPDGITGDGGPTYGNESLTKLQNGVIPEIHADDGSSAYTPATLVTTLTALMTSYRPDLLRLQDYVRTIADGDHPDHVSGAYFARQAHLAYTAPHTVIGYEDNPIRDRAANVTGADLAGKTAAFSAYLPFDRQPCGPAGNCTGTVYETWLARQYTVGFEQGGTPGNLATGKTATASSTAGAGFEAARANDGDATTRWASAAADNQWWRVDLGSAQSVNAVTIAWDAAFASSYQVQTSLDGVTFQTRATVSQATPGVRRATFTAVSARYVRVLAVTRGTAGGVSFGEVGVSGPGAAANVAPTAGAGPDQSVPAKATVTLDGTGSFDPQGTALTYAWTQTAGPTVTLSSATAARPTFRAPASDTTLRFALLVNDGTAVSVASTVTVNVGPVNVALGRPATSSSVETAGFEAAKANDGEAITRWSAATQGQEWWQVDLGAATAVDTVDVNWESAFAATYEIQTSSDGVTFTTVAAETATGAGNRRTVFAPTTTRYVRIRCLTPGSPYTYSITEVGVSKSTGANQVPTANAGPDQSVQTGTPVTLTGAASADPDGDPLTFRWSQVSGPAVTLSSTTVVAPTFTAPAAAGTLVFALIVNDGTADSVADTVTVTATVPVNQPPVANAGADQAVFTSRTVTLNGSGTDPEGRAITYRWAQTGGPAVTLSSTTAAKPTFTSPGTAATLTFALVVNDGTQNSVADTVTVAVTAPVNLALGRTTDASSTASSQNGANRAVDGSTSTAWASSWLDFDAWWQVDLGSAKTVGAVDVTWGSTYATQYRVQMSTDRVNWTTVATVTTSSSGLKRTVFTPRTARYVRIQTVSRSSFWSGAVIAETAVYAG